MLRETILEVFNAIWPMILIFSVVLVSLRLSYLIIKKQKFVLYKELISLLFILYILCLFHVVTLQDVTSSTNFTFFKEILRYEIGSKLFFKNVLGNMLMFMPYGFFVSAFFEIKKPYLILFLSFITSLTIEISQLSLGRIFDVDDIILNLLGGLFGYLIYKLLVRFRDRLPKFLKNEIFYNILIILVIIGLILYLGNIIDVGGIYE